MDNLMSSFDFNDCCMYICECECEYVRVRDYAIVDELFIFYGISVKLLTILSTYHSHCLFIILGYCCVCVFTCQFLNHVSMNVRYCVYKFFSLSQFHTLTQSFTSFFFIFFSVLFSTAQWCCCLFFLFFFVAILISDFFIIAL